MVIVYLILIYYAFVVCTSRAIISAAESGCTGDRFEDFRACVLYAPLFPIIGLGLWLQDFKNWFSKK